MAGLQRCELHCAVVSLLVSTMYCAYLGCHHWGNWGTGIQGLSVLFLLLLVSLSLPKN